MRNIWTIANREYKLYFSNPTAYMLSFMILFVVGILFYRVIVLASSPQAAGQFVPGVDAILGPMATLLMLATPAITARLLAEERRMGTIELLLTAPVRDWELVIGKWLAGFLLMLTIILVSLIYPLILNQLVSPGIDQGPLISGYLGIMLLAMAMVGIGVAISSLFNNQIAAFATNMGVLILLWWIVGPMAQSTGSTGDAVSTVLGYMDLGAHYFDNLIRGIVDLRDITYYLSVTALSLFFGSVVVETRRWQ